jgi:hypothetical protein
MSRHEQGVYLSPPLRVVSYNAAKPEEAFEDINKTQIFPKDRCFLLQNYGKR